MRAARPLLDRFLDKVPDQPGDDCWEWRGSRVNGYGRINLGRRGEGTAIASRVAYSLYRGDPGDFFVCHACDNPGCVNPRHLFLGTNLDNVRDYVTKGRKEIPPPKSACKNGHAYDESNTYVRREGWQQCRECVREAKRRFRERRLAA